MKRLHVKVHFFAIWSEAEAPAAYVKGTSPEPAPVCQLVTDTGCRYILLRRWVRVSDLHQPEDHP